MTDAELLTAHAEGGTDSQLASRFGVTRHVVRHRRYKLNLPGAAAAIVRSAQASACRAARITFSANANLRATALGLPPTTSAVALRAVELLASGPISSHELARQLHANPGHLLYRVLPQLRAAGTIRSTSQPRRGSSGAAQFLWSLSPTLFSLTALTPLQQRVAATPRALSTADYIASTYTLKLPHLEHDIRSAAYFGLIDAAQRYDPSRYQFSTFAARRVRGAIQDALRSLAPRGYTRNASSAPRRESDGSLDHASPSLPVGWELDSIDAIDSLTAALPDRERAVLRLYYAHGLNLKQIGARLGFSESLACQAHVRALTLLRSTVAV